MRHILLDNIRVLPIGDDKGGDTCPRRQYEGERKRSFLGAGNGEARNQAEGDNHKANGQ